MKAPAIEAGLGDNAERITKLRTQIARLTGRITVSRDLAYLEQRLAALKKAKAEGRRLPNSPRADSAMPVSVSITKRRRDLLTRICKEHQVGVSQIMRDAFDAWAHANGYRVEIEHIKRTEEDD